MTGAGSRQGNVWSLFLDCMGNMSTKGGSQLGVDVMEIKAAWTLLRSFTHSNGWAPAVYSSICVQSSASCEQGLNWLRGQMDPNETHQKDSKRRKNPKFYESMGVMCSDRLDGSVVLFWQSWQVLQKWSCLVWKPSCFNLSKNVCQKLTRSHMLWRGHVIQNALSSVAAMREVFRFGTALLCSSFAESIFMMVTAWIYLQLGTSKYMKPRQETSRNHLIAWQVFSSFSRFLPMHRH